MNGSLNINNNTTLKTNRILCTNSKPNSATFQKILSFLRKDKVQMIETQFSEPPMRARPFLQSGFLSGQILSPNNNDPESFHCAIRPVLSLAQMFGILPVLGIRRPSPLQLKFVKFSFCTIYAVFISTMVLVMAILSILHMIKTLNSVTFEVKGGIAAATAGAVFYTNCVIGQLIFFRLSPRWVTLQRDWRSMEQFIDSNKIERPKLRWKFNTISSSILFLALIEHIFSIIQNTLEYDWSGKSENSTFQNFLQVYCTSSHSFILQSLKYNFVLGIFIFIVSKLATFTWNFTDVFIMTVSTGLAERYRILNKHVMSSISKHQRIDWCGLREDYAALSCMVKKVDKNIAPIILLSFANNLYFICLQLLNGLSKPENGILSDIYFFGSFVFLIGRTVIVTLLTSRIHDQSKVILPLLYSCSTSTYNTESVYRQKG
ncbi:gustatory receptor for sugar taste 64e isoform X2 [Solenopsis invicta]|uniref:gustatory receptor for sugar taste 64e isoform X2 n=1 Tax=Solenopsis invicta TaxID=13686 RepID=UPI00193D1846|nr:gustatory receptor for sugar taste 64e isoform X2 [Solenopsis invicta]